MSLTTWLTSYWRSAPAASNGQTPLRIALGAARAATAAWKQRAEHAGRRIAALKAQLTALDARLVETRQQVAQQRAGREQQRLRETALEQRLARQAQVVAWAKSVAERSHRGVPSPRVLRGALPLRLRVAQVRARRDEARQAEARFAAVSPSYAAAAASASAPPPPGEPVVKADLQGLHWWVPVLRPRDAEPGSAWLRKQKFPYRGIAQTRELAMGGIMLDLGGNIGRMSLPRVILGDVSAAYCAEPDPVNYDCLVRNVIDNGLSGLVFPDNVAIGDRDGTATLSRASYCGGHSLVGTASTKGGTVTVPTTTLDAWVSRLGIDLDLVTFIKVDVQGWEGHVFAGAAEVLRRPQIAWQVEFKPPLLREAGTEPDELCRLLRDRFTHFTDLNKSATGARCRAIAELDEAVAYVETSESAQTDLLLFSQHAR